jgi:phosphoethanolamine N-methyltransferase
MSDSAVNGQYNEKFNVALQWMWGDGYLSPGGEGEARQILSGVDVTGKQVLDIGCGLGAVEVLLVRDYQAGHVTGIDVEAHLIEHSRQLAADNNIAARTKFVLVEPGPLEFDDDSFDVVFSKDAIVHIPDKASFYAEVLRVLRPGGAFVASDWLRGGEDTATDRALEWLSYVHLNYQMSEAPAVEAMIREAGFSQVRLNDRNGWYREEIERELGLLEGESLTRLESMVGADQASYRVQSSTMKRGAIDDGFLRPTHIFAVKSA